MANFKVKIEMEFDDEQMKDLFDSYDIKFTKKKLAEFKKEVKENSHEWLNLNETLEKDVLNELGDILNDLFGE